MHERNWKVPLMSFARQKPYAAFKLFLCFMQRKTFFADWKCANLHFWLEFFFTFSKHGLKLKWSQWTLYTVWLLSLLSILWKQGFDQVWFLWAYFTTEFLIPYSPWTYTWFIMSILVTYGNTGCGVFKGGYKIKKIFA